MALTSNELAIMRAAAEDRMPDTCVIAERTHTRDAVGSFVDADGTTYTDVPCFVFAVTPLRFPEQIASRMSDEPLWEIHVPWDQVINADCRVTHATKTYEVIWPEDLHSERLLRRAWMRRVP